MSASFAGEGLLAFRGNAFHAARNTARVTLRPPQQPDATKPAILSFGGPIGTFPFPGVWLGRDSDAAYGDVFIQFGANPGGFGPYTISMRFPGTTTGGAPPAAQGLYVTGMAGLVQTDVGVSPTTDILWTFIIPPFNGFSQGFAPPLYQFVIHYEWNVSH